MAEPKTPEEIARDCIALIPLTTADARKVEAAIAIAITRDREETIARCARVVDDEAAGYRKHYHFDEASVARQIAEIIRRSLSPSREEDQARKETGG